MKAMAVLRNILVHGYAAVEPEKVVECSKRVGQDALRIAEAIISALEGRGIDPFEDEAVAKIRDVLRGRVRLAYLFGRRAKGYSLKGDYDVAVNVEGGCDLYELGLLQVDLSEALGDERVDVVCLNSAPPDMVLEALPGVPVIDDPALRAELNARALAELNDVEITTRRAYRRWRLAAAHSSSASTQRAPNLAQISSTAFLTRAHHPSETSTFL